MRPAKPRKTHVFIALALLSSFAISACGIRGPLKTPPPIWGGDKSAPVETPAKTTDNTTDNADSDNSDSDN